MKLRLMTEFGFSWSDVHALQLWELQLVLEELRKIDDERERARVQRKAGSGGLERIL